MRDTKERVQVVLRKTARKQRSRSKAVLSALSLCAVFLGVGLVGAIGTFSSGMTAASVVGLYGSASLLGGDVGGYVIVAVVSFALAVVLTLLFVKRTNKPVYFNPADFQQKDESHD